MPHSHSVEYIQTKRLIHVIISEASLTAQLEHVKHSKSKTHSSLTFTALNTVTPSGVSKGDNYYDIFHKMHPSTAWKCNCSSKTHQKAELTKSKFQKCL